ncbi:MAG TPA: acetylxylan esterase [Chryseosolibacter sp.]
MNTPRRPIQIAILLTCALAGKAFAQEELNVIRTKEEPWLQYTDAPNALYHHLAGEAYGLLQARAKTIRDIHSLSAWKERQNYIRETLQKIAGPFPEKTPLNAQVLGVVDKDTYRVEHIVYESQPKFYVTSSLFIPKSLKKKKTAPAVIYCSGHSENGYRSDVYQHVILNLVKKGFIVFAFDPVGQGERLEYYDMEKEKSSVGGPTSEHSYPGSQAFITGSSQARYMIWDGIRAVDYLLTRREVDPSRIGITGRSGGGTQSAYIAAFDERIKAAAPECYITSFTRLLQSIGPQDAEQNFFHGIANGIDHADLLLVRAPKPALMITTTRDMFSIQGARETAKEVSRIYDAYGQQANFAMVEDDAPHASTKKNREAMYAFFQKHLDNPGSPADEDVALLNEAEIRVTSTGQVSTSLGGETVFSLNEREAARCVDALEQLRQNEGRYLATMVAEAKNLSGYREPAEVAEPVFTGRIQRDGYAIEKYFVKGEGDYVIPYLLVVPRQGNHKAILYLHPSGKAAEASPEGEIEWIAGNGFTVLAPDLPGVGELGAGAFQGDSFIGGVSHNVWYASILIGRSIVGVQAADIARLTRVLEENLHMEEVYGVARKEMAPALLHAAAFTPSIRRVALINPLSSYRSVVMNRFYSSPFITGAVPGLLQAYDLPDLASALAPRKLTLAGVIDGKGASGDTDKDLAVIRKAYEQIRAEDQLRISPSSSEEELGSLFTEWVR